METKKIEILYKTIPSAELSSEESILKNKAIEAAKKAYVPYSQFRVGAAIALENGGIVTGSNQENAAYPSGMCAERVAMFAANHQYPNSAPLAIALVAINNNEIADTISPCGACRQVLLESEKRFGKKIKLYLCGREETILIESIADSLPFCFDSSQMSK